MVHGRRNTPRALAPPMISVSRTLSAGLSILVYFLSSCGTTTAAPTLPRGFYRIQPPVTGNAELAGTSDDGLLAAGMVTSGNTRQMFLWDPVGGSRLVPTPVGMAAREVGDISADGSTVVGQISIGSVFNREVFRWTNSTGYQRIGKLSTDSSDSIYATAVSANGSVFAGYSDTPNGYRAYRWTSATGLQNLGTLGRTNAFYPPWSFANGVSDDGSIVVGSTTVVGEEFEQAALWTSTNGWQVIGSLPDPFQNSTSYGLTSNGATIVGFNQGNGIDATIWTQADGLRALPRLAGFGQGGARLISDDGSLITGQVTSSSRGYAVA
jgi:probable HAF family extracellular repeat protein